jgi:hypothetical protein
MRQGLAEGIDRRQRRQGVDEPGLSHVMGTSRSVTILFYGTSLLFLFGWVGRLTPRVRSTINASLRRPS